MPVKWKRVDPKKETARGAKSVKEVCAESQPLYPSYLFLKFAADVPWFALSKMNFPSGTPIIQNWIRNPVTGEPYILSPVETLMLKSVLPTFEDTLKRFNAPFKPGSKVRVVNGPFAGMMLKVEVDSGREHVQALGDRLGMLKLPRSMLKQAEAA
jgi:transcription antitermination factor NusG